VGLVPDLLLLRKSDSSGNRTRTSGSVARIYGHYHRGSQLRNMDVIKISLYPMAKEHERHKIKYISHSYGTWTTVETKHGRHTDCRIVKKLGELVLL
jgi:hypothetical protein